MSLPNSTNKHITKTVSLVIPTCGRVDDLARLLASLKEHGYEDKPWFSVVIVDNNSGAADQEKVRVLCHAHGAQFAHEPVQGKSYAVNRGIAISRTDFVAFTDDDTIVAQDDWIEILLAHFAEHPKLAYVSGNVVAMNKEHAIAGTWEKKGGLSKGLATKYWSRHYLTTWPYTVMPWQFNKMCAGANNVVRRSVLEEIGGYNIMLEGTPPFHAGATIEIGYRIARAGYELMYDPNSRIWHEHPTTEKELMHKMFAYGQGDTGYQMSNFLQFGDLRCLWWSLIGHSCYTVSFKVARRMVGRYPLPMKYILAGLAGNIIGGPRFAWNYFLKGKSLINNYQTVADNM